MQWKMQFIRTLQTVYKIYQNNFFYFGNLSYLCKTLKHKHKNIKSMSRTCSYCGKNFSIYSNEYNYSNDATDAYFRDSQSFKLYNFCCDGHFQQYKNITDMTWVNESGLTASEECDRERERRRQERLRNTTVCHQCGHRFRNGEGVSAYFRTEDKQHWTSFDFCDTNCIKEYGEVSRKTHVDSDGLTYDERAIKVATIAKHEKEIKIYTNELLNKLLTKTIKLYNELYNAQYNKSADTEERENLSKIAMKFTKKCQTKMHDTIKTKLTEFENIRDFIKQQRHIIYLEFDKSLTGYTWEQLVKDNEVKKEEPKQSEKKSQPEIIQEFTKGVNEIKTEFTKGVGEIKTEFKKAFTDIKTEFKNLFKK